MLTSQGHPRNLEGLPLLTLSMWNLASKESRGGYVGVGGWIGRALLLAPFLCMT